MFNEEVFLDLLCSSVREPESEPEPWEPYDYTWSSRSRFFEKVGAGAVFLKSHTAPQHWLKELLVPVFL